jgi:nitrite reductase/ring-hydroxylating ferredoxin subunit
VARTKIAETKDVPPGTATSVDAGGKTLALFNVDGTLFAVDNTCAHRGGPLGEGDLDGAVVTCPWHGWRATTSGRAFATGPRRSVSPATRSPSRTALPTWICDVVPAAGS